MDGLGRGHGAESHSLLLYWFWQLDDRHQGTGTLAGLCSKGSCALGVSALLWLAAALLQLLVLNKRHHSSYVFLCMPLLTGILVILDQTPPVRHHLNLILSSETQIYFQI